MAFLTATASRAEVWNWTYVGAPMGDPNVGAILVDPVLSNTWYVSSWNGIYITRNGGSTWENHLSGYSGALGIDPTHTDRLFVSSDYNLYRSEDKGLNWKRIGVFPGYVESILISEVDGSVYVGIKWQGDPGNNGIFKSTNHGDSFTHHLFATPDSSLIMWDIEEDPYNNKLYVATEIASHPPPYQPPFFRSSNGGLTWDEISGTLGWHCIKVQVHPTSHDVFALTEGLGLYRSTDFGDNWQYLNQDFGLGLLIDKNNPDRFYGGNHTTGTWIGGVYFSINGGVSFDQIGLSGIQIGSLSLDASSSVLHCASYGSGIYTGVSTGPRTWYIKPDGSGDAPTIQAGVDSATAGDTVMLADGTFTGVGNRDIDLYSKAIAVVSESGDPDSCIVDCEGAARGFKCADATSFTRLRGFTITNGLATFGGSYTQLGGGLYCEDSHDGPVVVGCVFSNNHAEGHGGGVNGGSSGTPVFTNCKFIENTADLSGGAFFSWSGSDVCSPSFSGCFFLRNSAAGMGGGVMAGSPTSGSGTFANCVFYGNKANMGGGVYAQFYQCDITNCTFAADSAGVGGEIYCDNSSPDIENSIFAFSVAGGAISCNSASPTLTYCDVYGNAGGDWTGCISGQSGDEGNFSLNPLFCNPDSDDFGLASLSYCLPTVNLWGILIGAIAEGCDEPIGVGSHEANAAVFALRQNYPNPFNPSTTIVYSTQAAGRVNLSIYDVSGRLVKTLVDKELPTGPHKAIWDGRNDAGGMVSAGVYFARLESARRRQSRKLVLLK